uniref:CSON006113 protein n=1 Tax=Culicoides sonorensis TaxID=179676 RepID=A0A336LYL2_CULSO
MQLYNLISTLFICLCHLQNILSLPITSQPLASNPEHLTWDAWQMPENSGRHPDQKAKKITPKSIFITPNFQTSSSHICPPNHKLDGNNRCIEIVKINEDESLANRIQALLGQTTSQANNQLTTDGEDGGGDLYDYDYEEDGSDGPYQLNLPLTFEAVYPEEALPLKAGEETLLPFPAPNRPNHDDDSQSDAGTISYISVEKISNSTEEMDNDEETQNKTTTTIDEFNSSDSDRDNNSPSSSTTEDGRNRYESSTVSGITTESTDSDYPLPSSSSTENQTSTTFDDGLSSSNDLPESTLSTIIDDTTTESTLQSSTTFNPNNSSTSAESNDYSITLTANETSVLEELNQAMKINVSDIFGDPFSEVVTGEMEWINYGNDTDELVDDDSFLENESFIVTNPQKELTVTTQQTDTTLEVNESGQTMESSGSADTDYPLPSSSSAEYSFNSKESTVTETPLFIVTPETTTKVPEVKEQWHPTLIQAPTRVHHKIAGIKTTTSRPSTIEDVEKILLGPSNEQSTEMKDREHANKHEKNEAYLENLDSNNRFVYHHLTSTTTTSSTTKRPSYVTNSNDRILNQIKEINRIVTENRLRHPNYPTNTDSDQSTRIRFPTDYNSQSNDFTFPQTPEFTAHTGSRFAPSYNTNKFNTYSMHFTQSSTTVPPQVTSTATPTTKPPFWWLPPGWQVDQSGQKPTLLRFWERMPLVRDPSMMQRSSSRSNRHDI